MKLYVIGDSISIQYGPYLEADLRGVMGYARKEGEEEALLNLDIPQGANGGDSSMVRAFLAAKAAAGGIDADLLLLNCGLHDIKTDPATGAKQIPIEKYVQNLAQIVQIVRTMGPTLVWLRTTPCDETIHNHAGMAFHRFAADGRAYNAVADGIMAEHEIPSIDLYTFTRNLGDDLYCDHVHFHDHIRRQQAAFIAGWLAGFAQRQREA
jgi:lysophospholipase L1-like esterase